MGRVKKLWNARVSGSSLIEVITAVVIISIVFTIASVVYLNVQRSGFSAKKLRASIVVNELIISSLKEKRFESLQREFGEFVLYQTVDLYAGNRNLKILIVEARDETGKLIAQRKKLVYDSAQP